MGILIALHDYYSTILFLIYFTVLHMLGIFYFWKIHPLFFKSPPTKMKAFTISLIGIGFGQVYNRQVVKGIFFGSIIPLLGMAVLNNNDFAETKQTYIALIFLAAFIIPWIDAVGNAQSKVIMTKYSTTKIPRSPSTTEYTRTTEKTPAEIRREREAAAFKRWSESRKQEALRKEELREKEFNDKVATIRKYIGQQYEFAVDTNILMHEQELLMYLLENDKIVLNMSRKVFDELEGLKNNPNPNTRKQAQYAFDVIENFQKNGLLNLMDSAKSDQLKKHGLGYNSDERIIGTYLLANKNGGKIIFLSNDKGARIMARNAGLPVVDFN